MRALIAAIMPLHRVKKFGEHQSSNCGVYLLYSLHTIFTVLTIQIVQINIK